MARRNENGEGTIYQRKDGRYEGALFVQTISGRRKRIRVYGTTRNEVHNKLTAAKVSAQSGISTPDRAWKLGDYLAYWLENVIRPTKRPSTYEQYEWISRKFLAPKLGHISIDRLLVSEVQKYLNSQSAEGYSPHRLRLIRMILGAALARAQREELIIRNVARHVEMPTYEPDERNPWSVEEARSFYEQAKEHSLYPAFVLLQVYSLRREKYWIFAGLTLMRRTWSYTSGTNYNASVAPFGKVPSKPKLGTEPCV